MKNKVAIIGGGPAGIATAIQLKRYKIEHILFEQKSLGGLLKNAYKIENYPGFPQGIPGLELVELFKTQLESYNINVMFEQVKLLEYNEKEKLFLINSSKSLCHSNIVVIASGTKPKRLDIVEALPEMLKCKIFYDIYSILNMQDKRIVIIGAGDIAFDYALNLSKTNEVIIINRNNQIKALPILRDRVMKTSKIKYHEDLIIQEISPGREKALLTTFLKNGKVTTMEADYIVIAIGRLPHKDFYSDNLVKVEKKLLSQNSLYLTGDVKNGIFRQVAIAVGDGIEAAMEIYKKIKEK